MGDNWFTRGAAELDPSRSVGKFFTKIDPTTVKKADTSQVQNVAANIGNMAQGYANKQVPLYTPQQVQAQEIRAARMGVPMGAGEMNSAIRSAQGNVGQAGQLDPQVAAYLQAAQQGGQNTAQSLQYLQQAAAGQGPSAAQNQLRSGMDEAIRAQMTAAASRGFSPAAMRGAQMQGAELQQQAANQAAFLRAQEMQAAQQAYATGSLQQEQQARQAALQAGQTTLQQQVASDEAKQAAINAYLSGSGQLLQSGTQLTAAQAQLQQQAALANQEAMLKAGMFNNQLGLDAAQLQQVGQLGYGQLAAGLYGTQLGAYGDILGLEQQRYNQSAKARSELIGGLISGGSSMGASALGSGGALSGAGAAGGAGAGGAAAAAPAAVVASDRNMKKDIKVNKETQAFLNALTDNEYSYKDTTQAGTAPGRQYGPMAQDLAKTKMGKTAVIDGPDGMMVDSSRGFLLALSGLANINQRLNKLGV
jgi:hypothetical protein